MRATVLTDNLADAPLSGEWGLCIHIEYRGKRFLLDTGASPLFEQNAARLDIPLDEVEAGVLSHAHYDHANGMDRFFAANRRAVFYLQKSCGENCYKKVGFFKKYIGIRRGLLRQYRNRLVYAEGPRVIAPGVHLVPHSTPGLEAVGRQESMLQRRGLRWEFDNFSHEQSLVFETAQGLVVFNSCSHGGVENILREAKAACPGQRVRALVGGFHLFNKGEPVVRQLAEQLREAQVQAVYTGHCTGERAFAILREELGDLVHPLRTGLVIEFDGENPQETGENTCHE